MSLSHFPVNPNYGTGCFRRLVRTYRVPGKVLVTLDDTHHSMWLLMSHVQWRISGIDARVERGPATSCGSATSSLATLVGLDVKGDVAALRERLPPVLNCTHLTDLAHWAFRSATGKTLQKREVSITVPDETGDGVWIAVERDGITIHRWRIKGHRIIEPALLADNPVMRGFHSWARRHFSGEELDLAVMLQRGVFVARGRRHLVDLSPPVPLRAASVMRDACHSYSKAHFDTATTVVGYVRDFSKAVIAAPLPSFVTDQFKGYFE